MSYFPKIGEEFELINTVGRTDVKARVISEDWWKDTFLVEWSSGRREIIPAVYFVENEWKSPRSPSKGTWWAKCTCGAEKVGHPGHTFYCDKEE